MDARSGVVAHNDTKRGPYGRHDLGISGRENHDRIFSVGHGSTSGVPVDQVMRSRRHDGRSRGKSANERQKSQVSGGRLLDPRITCLQVAKRKSGTVRYVTVTLVRVGNAQVSRCTLTGGVTSRQRLKHRPSRVTSPVGREVVQQLVGNGGPKRELSRIFSSHRLFVGRLIKGVCTKGRDRRAVSGLASVTVVLVMRRAVCAKLATFTSSPENRVLAMATSCRHLGLTAAGSSI